MKKLSRKDRPVLIFISIAVGLVLIKSLFFENGIHLHFRNPSAPTTADEQQALIRAQEQEDERGQLGPLKASVSPQEAQDTVLDLKTFGNR